MTEGGGEELPYLGGAVIKILKAVKDFNRFTEFYDQSFAKIIHDDPEFGDFEVFQSSLKSLA